MGNGKIRLFDAEKEVLSGSQAPDIIFSPVLPGFFPLLPDVLSVAERWTFLKEAVPYMDAGLKCWIVQSKHPGMIPGLYLPCWLLYYRRLQWLGWPLPYQLVVCGFSFFVHKLCPVRC